MSVAISNESFGRTAALALGGNANQSTHWRRNLIVAGGLMAAYALQALAAYAWTSATAGCW